MRLTDDMRAHAAKLRRLADGYRMTCAKALASDCLRTANAIDAAVTAMDNLARATDAARRIAEVE